MVINNMLPPFKALINFALLLLTLGICSAAHAVERYVGLGYYSYNTELNLNNIDPIIIETSDSAISASIGFRNQYGKTGKNHFGLGLDFSSINDDRMIGFRALDYQRQITQHIRVGGFFGAATVNSGAAQNGYYFGGNVSWMNLISNFDIVAEYRRGDGLARDVIASDPETTSPDIFLDFSGIALSLNWRF